MYCVINNLGDIVVNKAFILIFVFCYVHVTTAIIIADDDTVQGLITTVQYLAKENTIPPGFNVNKNEETTVDVAALFKGMRWLMN